MKQDNTTHTPYLCYFLIWDNINCYVLLATESFQRSMPGSNQDPQHMSISGKPSI